MLSQALFSLFGQQALHCRRVEFSLFYPYPSVYSFAHPRQEWERPIDLGTERIPKKRMDYPKINTNTHTDIITTLKDIHLSPTNGRFIENDYSRQSFFLLHPHFAATSRHYPAAVCNSLFKSLSPNALPLISSTRRRWRT